jgi:hypothetical protein
MAGPLVAGLLLLPEAPARAEDAAPPPVKLDQLLKLPTSVEYDLERKGGATRTEWKGRYKAAQADVASAKKAYDSAMGKLEKAAVGADSWRFVPPGGDVTAENQDNVRIRQDVTKKRDELARAEKRLKDLDVEADLASVPPEWRQ